MDEFHSKLYAFQQGETKASECFVTTELAKQVFQHADGVTAKAPTFPYQPEDYRSEAVYQPTPDDADSIPVTSDRDSGEYLGDIEVVSFISR